MTPPEPPFTTGPAGCPPEFTLHQVIDRRHQGLVAGALEFPVGWQARSDVIWTFEDVSFPVVTWVQGYNPGGPQVFELLPSESYCWVEPNPGTFPTGQRTMGQTYLPPIPAAQALARYVVPKFRGDRQGLRILGLGPSPDLAALGRGIGIQLPDVPTDEVCARLEYVENGRQVEEEIHGMNVQIRVPYYGPLGMMTQINWGFLWLFAFRTAAGSMDADRATFWRIAGSIRPNPRWEELRARILQQLQNQFDQYIQAGYSQIQAAGQMSRAISANNDAMLAGFEQQRQAVARADAARRQTETSSSSDGFSDYIRGVERMADPQWGESRQDYNYQYHWTDGFGNYRHSNDPFFNPNSGSSESWTLMRRPGGQGS